MLIFITLKDVFAPLTSCFSTHQKSKLLLPLAPSLMLLLQYGTLYLLTYVTLHLFIHSPLISKPTFPTLVHSLIHIDLMVNGWHRFEPLPISHVPIRLGGALIATCDTGGVTEVVLTENLTFGKLI